MKKILSGLIAVAFAFGATAQTGEKTEGNTQHENRLHQRFEQNPQRFDKIAQKLNLSEDQKTRMKTANETFAQQMKALNQNENITVKEQKERRQAIVSQHQTQIDAILTTEQKSKMQELKGSFRPGRNDKGMVRGDRMDRFKSLNLTDEQQNRMKTINEDFKTRIQSVQNNSSLTDVQKKEQLKSLHEQHANDIKSLLTPEQKEKFKESGKNRRGIKAI